MPTRSFWPHVVGPSCCSARRQPTSPHAPLSYRTCASSRVLSQTTLRTLYRTQTSRSGLKSSSCCAHSRGETSSPASQSSSAADWSLPAPFYPRKRLLSAIRRIVTLCLRISPPVASSVSSRSGSTSSRRTNARFLNLVPLRALMQHMHVRWRLSLRRLRSSAPLRGTPIRTWVSMVATMARPLSV